MPGYSITRIGETKDDLGEGLLWIKDSGELLWTDALSGVLHVLNLETGSRRDLNLQRSIGALALGADDEIYASLSDGFYTIDMSSGACTRVSDKLVTDPALRLNDGAVDPQGRFISGMMHIRPPEDGVLRGNIWRLGKAGQAQNLGGGVQVFNGPCFSPAGDRFYFTDSPSRKIMVADYSADTISIDDAQTFIDLTAMNTRGDGATVDTEGCLWISLIGSGQIGRFDPDGALMQLIDMPVTLPTNVAFGGPNLDILFVTSISKTPNVEATEDGAGGLFRIDGLGVTGRLEHQFSR